VAEGELRDRIAVSAALPSRLQRAAERGGPHRESHAFCTECERPNDHHPRPARCFLSVTLHIAWNRESPLAAGVAPSSVEIDLLKLLGDPNTLRRLANWLPACASQLVLCLGQKGDPI
jgi:hypothetical protein